MLKWADFYFYAVHVCKFLKYETFFMQCNSAMHSILQSLANRNCWAFSVEIVVMDLFAPLAANCINTKFNLKILFLRYLDIQDSNQLYSTKSLQHKITFTASRRITFEPSLPATQLEVSLYDSDFGLYRPTTGLCLWDYDDRHVLVRI